MQMNRKEIIINRSKTKDEGEGKKSECNSVMVKCICLRCCNTNNDALAEC